MALLMQLGTTATLHYYQILTLSLHLRNHSCHHFFHCLAYFSKHIVFALQNFRIHPFLDPLTIFQFIAYIAYFAFRQPKLSYSISHLCPHHGWISTCHHRCRVPASAHAITCTFSSCSSCWITVEMALISARHIHERKHNRDQTRTDLFP